MGGPHRRRHSTRVWRVVKLKLALAEVHAWLRDCCDECDGGGTYYIDGVAQECICAEVQHEAE